MLENIKKQKEINKNFDAITISIASPENIKSWSSGEVKKSDTINYRTVKPENSGLFCAKIFGPVQNYECSCGKYKRIKYKGTICEKCGVEITTSKIRRERMGHIALSTPVTHIWFLRSLPSRICTILNINLKSIEKVLHYDAYIVNDPGITNLKYGELISEDKYYKTTLEFGEYSFKAGIGPEIIKDMLRSIDLRITKKNIRKELLKTKSDINRKKIIKRLKIIDDFMLSKNKLEWMILDVLPVISPDLRPLVMLEGGRFATSDLNELYRRVLNRNNRLKKLINLKAPVIIVRNEKRMLQEAVDSLFDNSRKNKNSRSYNKKILKSLSDMLKGKHGRFRQNLLGKRVDYSGRSVIIVGAELKLKQCGIPKKMALELMKPFVYSKLGSCKISSTIKESKKMVDEENSKIWHILEKVMRNHPIILNRAPTLHRLGIQAFEPILINEKAIQLHPLVCAAFNADFDGDQMAIHIPLSIESQLEARILMMSDNNILNSANGDPIIIPTQDIVLGVYYLSLSFKGQKGERMIFNKVYDMEHALRFPILSIHANINFIIKNNIIRITPGRILIFSILYNKYKFILHINKIMNKEKISILINEIYRNLGKNLTVKFVDNIMKIGFHYACKSGLSIGKNDLLIPKTKRTYIKKTINKIFIYENQYCDGLITSQEKYNKTIDEWTKCGEKIAEDMMHVIDIRNRNTKICFKDLNSMYIMSNSGARGSANQIRQLAGMRGLMTKPSGEIIENPIISNFKEGLDSLEYFISTHGARKGLSDTALKTANSGYLTRKLVDVAQDCIIIEKDCYSSGYILIERKNINNDIDISLREKIFGRTINENIILKSIRKIILKNSIIDEKLLKLIEKNKINSIKIRSPIFCESNNGVCQKCYGMDLATGRIINLGEAVGIISAQSIGEPGTQLTMRTFHIGGTAQKIKTKSNIVSPQGGIIKMDESLCVINRKGDKINIGKKTEIIIQDEKLSKMKIPYGANILIKNGDVISLGDKIAEWDPFIKPIIAEKNGYIKYENIKKDISIKEMQDKITGITRRFIIDSAKNNKKIKPKIYIIDKNKKAIKSKEGKDIEYYLPTKSIINVKNKQKVLSGDVISKIPIEYSKSKDITGGLPRVVELFEARNPKESAILSEIEGYVICEHHYVNKKKIIIESEDKKMKMEYFIPKDRNLLVNEGEYIYKGDVIIDGNLSPHDILRILGKKKLTEFMIDEIQQVYKLQGVRINNKHIEVILKQMLKKVEIKNPGDTIFIKGEQLTLENVKKINKIIKKNKYREAKYEQLLQGITRAALQTNSFLSAASFQETVKVLTEAAFASKHDYLEGLKENVIAGRLIPAGTGFYRIK